MALLHQGWPPHELDAMVELESYKMREELGHWNVVVMGFDVQRRDLAPSVIGSLLVSA